MRFVTGAVEASGVLEILASAQIGCSRRPGPIADVSDLAATRFARAVSQYK